MDKFFKNLNNFARSKYFKVLFGLIVIILLFYINFDKKYIDLKKGQEVISKVSYKKLNKIKNVSDIIDAKYETILTEKPNLKKKSLIPDSEIKKDIKKEEEIKKITNFFLKLKNIDEIYEKRLRNNQINKSRRVKYGDYIYYSMEAMFENNNNKHPVSHFFIKISKNDFISENLIGKKVGQSIEFNYVDMVNNIPEEEKKTIEYNLEKTIDEINKQYSVNGTKIFNNNKLLYRIKVLDFMSEKIINDLYLDQ